MGSYIHQLIKTKVGLVFWYKQQHVVCAPTRCVVDKEDFKLPICFVVGGFFLYIDCIRCVYGVYVNNGF